MEMGRYLLTPVFKKIKEETEIIIEQIITNR
jgi:hypothetical protein